ncbi:MAG: RagB/SusD family nutrient uptake outer membrane protein, partial [Cyclobacteriaceae bacterium]
MTHKYLLFSLLICSLLACEEFLENPPLDAIGNDSYWNTAEDLEKYVIKYYPQFPGHGNSMATEDANSDNLTLGSPNSVLNGERPITTGNWISEWSNIRSINIFFDNYHQVSDDFSSYKHFLGEAYFFKAWFYFDLLKQYGDLPWYEHSLQPNTEELLKPRAPRNTVADSILLQIDKAISYLDTRSVVGNTRLNKETALAFKTRVALFEGSWQKYHANSPFGTPGAQPEKYFQAAVDAAENLMQGDYTKGIYNNGLPEEDYYTLFGLDNMDAVDEVLFYRAGNSGEGLGSNVQFYTTVRTGQKSVTWSLISSYLGRDGQPINYLNLAEGQKGNDFLTRISEAADPRLHGTIWIPGDVMVARTNEQFDKPFIDRGAEELNATGFQVKKFANPESPGAGALCCGISETGYILFRYGEVLLNYAEAKYELENVVAYDALNLLRERVGMPAFEVMDQSEDPNSEWQDYGYEISDELYEIRRERRIELALEGFRGDDYRRWAAHPLFKDKRPLGYPYDPQEFPDYQPPLNESGLIDFFVNLMPNGYQFRPDQDYLNDIPQDELSLNPNLEQNPGW